MSSAVGAAHHRVSDAPRRDGEYTIERSLSLEREHAEARHRGRQVLVMFALPESYNVICMHHTPCFIDAIVLCLLFVVAHL
jgi:hypothetical protein